MPNNIDEYFDGLSSSLLSFTDYYEKKVIWKILDNEKYADEPERFYFTIISKVNGSLEAANILVRNFHSHPHFHPSLYVILRSVLSDIIIGEYVKMVSKNDEEVKENIRSIYGDHVLRTFNQIDGIYARLSEWNKEKVKEEKEKFIYHNSTYLDETGKPKFKSLDTGSLKMISTIFSQKSAAQDFSVYRYIFSHYDLFSKYEHFGELSFRLVHKHYLEKSIREQFADVCQCMGIIVTVLITYCSVWDDLLTEEMEVLQKMREDIFQYDLGVLSEE
jgi:hypothetical protein